jgi:hypothetical protein
MNKILTKIELNNENKVTQFLIDLNNEIYTFKEARSCFFNALKFTKNEKIINMFIDDKYYQTKELKNMIALSSTELGSLWVFKKMIKDPDVSLLYDDNFHICLAAQNGYLDIVLEIMKEEDVDIIATQNYAIRNAYHNQHMDIVKLLWKEQKVKDTLEKNSKKLYKILREIDFSNNLKSF